MPTTCPPRAPRPPSGADPTMRMFASRSVPVHVVRGVLGLVLLVAGLVLSAQTAWWLLLVPVTVVLWRGCPTCWVMGLMHTAATARVEEPAAER